MTDAHVAVDVIVEMTVEEKTEETLEATVEVTNTTEAALVAAHKRITCDRLHYIADSVNDLFVSSPGDQADPPPDKDGEFLISAAMCDSLATTSDSYFYLLLL